MVVILQLVVQVVVEDMQDHKLEQLVIVQIQEEYHKEILVVIGGTPMLAVAAVALVEQVVMVEILLLM